MEDSKKSGVVRENCVRNFRITQGECVIESILGAELAANVSAFRADNRENVPAILDVSGNSCVYKGRF